MSLPHGVDAPITCDDWDEVVDSLEWQDYSYICYKEGATYHAKNGQTMVITLSHADAYTVIQHAVDNITDGGLIYIKKGTYPLTDEVVVEEKTINFVGSGQDTLIEPAANKYAFVFQSDGTGVFDYPGGVRNLRIEHDAASCSGVKFYDAPYGDVYNLQITVQQYGVYIGGVHDNTSFNTKVRNTTIRALAANGVGIYVNPGNNKVCADVNIVNCMIHDSDYGIRFTEGANGPHIINCGVLGSDVAAYQFEGSYGGGWIEACFADQCNGDGFVVTNSTNWFTYGIQFTNIWAATCNYGMKIVSDGVQHVDEIIVQGLFFLNALAGIRIEGDVIYCKIHDSRIRDNNTDNVATVDATNLLIYNDPQWIDVENCHIGFPNTNPGNREYAMRVYMDGAATRNIAVRVNDTMFIDPDDTTKARIGLRNTHGVYAVNIHLGVNNSLENPPYGDNAVVEAGSTGTIAIYDRGPWTSTYTALPAMFDGREGQITYLQSDGTNPGIAYMGMETIAGGYEWAPIGMTDNVLIVFDDLDPAVLADAGATVANDAWFDYLGNAYLKLKYGGADRVEVGNTEVIIQNTPLQMKTQSIQFAADDAERISSDGTDMIFWYNTAAELKLNATALYPAVASGLNLGTDVFEYQHAYIAGTLYLFTDQDEYVKSDGTDVVWGVGGGDELKLDVDKLYPATASGLDLGGVNNEYGDIYLSDRIYFFADQGESVRSDGTDLIWGISGNDELHLNASALHPHAASGLDLGTPDEEWQHAYIADTLYFYTDQAEYIKSDGSNLIFGVTGGDVMTLDGTQLLAGGVNLGAVGTQFGDAYIDGTAYIDGLTIEVSLDVDDIDINATGVGSVTAVVPVASEGGTNYIALYDGYS